MKKALTLDPSLLDYQLPPGQPALPCRLLVIADPGCDSKEPMEPQALTSMNAWLERHQPQVSCQLSGTDTLTFTFRQLEDLQPEALYQQLCQQLDKPTTDDEFSLLTREQEHLELLNQVYKNPRLRQLEATWRSLDRLVRQAQSSPTTQIHLLAMSSEQLHDDLDQELTTSQLFEWVYSQELGQYGGQPFSALLVDHYWSPHQQDLASLKQLALLGQVAHCPVISSLEPSLIGMQDFTDPLDQELLENLISSRRFIKLRQLMASEAARYLTLTLPRVLLRAPYQQQLGSAWFQENGTTPNTSLLWGHPGYPLASQLLQSFQQLGAYTGLLHSQGKLAPTFSQVQLGSGQVRQSPLEVNWSPNQINQLVKLGFSPWQPGGEGGQQLMLDRAVSLHAGQEPRASRLTPDNQLLFLMTTCRVAHYLKQLVRELLGTSANLETLEAHLNQWLQGIVSAQERPVAEVLHRKPFRQASLRLQAATPTEASMHLELTPHLRYQGESFTLNLTSPLVGGAHG
ncbi:type VI secretion system protein ImpC [Marinospirillum celere]|uniref:Type VI secretion system protein ImpC n=1 Tax=Marinospirillum celere TaxID=1122252 RepID=A0A1I1H481_9GAMM|nr:type VI secretion system contractile sheath large subunit [Marinospirillum celere]SFC18744.1 type VI secretion system protein ImpC [Marinospirillum celere]